MKTDVLIIGAGPAAMFGPSVGQGGCTPWSWTARLSPEIEPAEAASHLGPCGRSQPSWSSSLTDSESA
jgi:hypothetical protein